MMLRNVGDISLWKSAVSMNDHFYYTLYKSKIIYICNRFTLKHISIVMRHKCEILKIYKLVGLANGAVCSIDVGGNAVVWTDSLGFIRSFTIRDFRYKNGDIIRIRDGYIYLVYCKHGIIYKYDLYGNLVIRLDLSHLVGVGDFGDDYIDDFNIYKNMLIFVIDRKVYLYKMDGTQVDCYKMFYSPKKLFIDEDVIHVGTCDQIKYDGDAKKLVFIDKFYFSFKFSSGRTIKVHKDIIFKSPGGNLVYCFLNNKLVKTYRIKDAQRYQPPHIFVVDEDIYFSTTKSLHMVCEFRWDLLGSLDGRDRTLLEPLMVTLKLIPIQKDLGLLFARSLLYGTN